MQNQTGGYRGLFVGLSTLDLVYLVTAPPQPNQKIVALDSTIAAGGPATNAAVTFAHLGNHATILASLGQHPIAGLMQADLENYAIAIADLQPQRTESPPVSSILVTQASGERAVVSLNASRSQDQAEDVPAAVWQAIDAPAIDIVLIDGHQMQVGSTIAQQARTRQIPIVVDGGSWKPGFEQVLQFTDYAICSANFLPLGCQTVAEVAAYLAALGVNHIAITQGERPILVWEHQQFSEIPVPPVPVVDTLAAGDILHGAFCHFILDRSFTAALAQASQIAARACQFFGSRRWMK